MLFYILYIQQVLGIDAWTHSLYLYGSKVQHIHKAELEFYETVNRNITLADGRKIGCQIPLDPNNMVTSNLMVNPYYTKSKSRGKIFEDVSASYANQIFYPLQDLCVYHETNEFVWQFCYKKYVKQFDNENTVRNIQKKQYEEYYIGYSNSYNKLNNQTIGMYVPSWANMHVFTYENNPLIQEQLVEINRKTKFEFLTNEQPIPQQFDYLLEMSPQHPNTLGLFFSFKHVNQSQKLYKATIKVSLKHLGLRDVEFLFLSHPTPLIIARQPGTKGKYTRQDPRFDNQTLLNKNYWLIINLKEKSLTLGIGTRLTLKNTLINYKLKKFTDEVVPLSSIPVRFDIQMILLTQVLSVNLTDYQTKKLPWQPNGAHFSPLNFSGYAFLESMQEMSDVQYQYIEDYNAGEYCQDFQKTRHIVVRMICSHRSLLEIIKVNEPKVCNYKMEVGTYLLCDERDQVNYQEHAPSQVGQRIVCNMQ